MSPSELSPDVARTLLLSLGSGATIEQACQAAGIDRAAFDPWWQAELARRAPDTLGETVTTVRSGVQIVRDRWGGPHVFADNDHDLFFGQGFAQAQDRLWQLDYYRRRATGTLAEVLGPEAVESDRIVKTVGLPHLAEREWEQLDVDTVRALEAFAAGINAYAQSLPPERWPIEFALLGDEPRPWQPVDSLAVLAEFRWYLTGRFPVLCIPELARRVLGDGLLWQATITPEADDESILPPGSYANVRRHGEAFHPTGGGDPSVGTGSNNWVLAPGRTHHGRPLLASDPHIAYGALSCWHEAHLCGGGYNVAGMNYLGLPGIMFGRNEHVAWGITNNICSQRDLYLEETSPEHPGCFRFGDHWEKAATREEVIEVRGAAPVRFTVTSSRNGPIVSDVLPEVMRDGRPVSLKWLGACLPLALGEGPGVRHSGELAALLAANRAKSAAELRRSFETWVVPTFNVVYADTTGHVGYQAIGRIPVRDNWRHGYRRGWTPEDQWRELVTYDGMPHVENPARGWVGTANNRNAPPDYPYPLSGCWGPGHRGRRLRQVLDEDRRFTLDDCRRLQHDVVSLRAAEGVPGLLTLLDDAPADSPTGQACEHLRAWDYQMQPDSVAASIFEVFFQHWCLTVAAARFEPDQAKFIAGANWGLALRLLTEGDTLGWFENRDLRGEVHSTFERALDELRQRMGPDMAAWQWGQLHRLTMHHPLSHRGELGQLLDRGDLPIGGNLVTLNNMGYDENYRVVHGANYRMLVDLTEVGMWAASASGNSGNPGSLNYCDQIDDWNAGHEHFIPLAADEVQKLAVATYRLMPRVDDEDDASNRY